MKSEFVSSRAIFISTLDNVLSLQLYRAKIFLKENQFNLQVQNNAFNLNS